MDNQLPHLIMSPVTYTKKKDMQTKQKKRKQKRKNNKHHLRKKTATKKRPQIENKYKQMLGHNDQYLINIIKIKYIQ